MIWRKTVQKLILGLIIAGALVACETVEDMRDMRDTQEQLKALIKESIGVEPQVGFNISNGTLIDVSIALNADEVADRTIAELKRAARSAVKKTFDSKPRAIYIQLATTAD